MKVVFKRFSLFADLFLGTSITRITRILISFVSVTFMIVPMISLTYINSVRFVLLGAFLFSILFAIFVAMNRAKPQEIFVATAAYAGVIAVFVSNTVQRL